MPAVSSQRPADKWDPPVLNTGPESVDFLGSLHQVAVELKKLNENIETFTHRDDAQRVLTLDDAADILKVSAQTVGTYCAQGLLTHSRLGDSDRAPIRLALEDVLDFAFKRRKYEA